MSGSYDRKSVPFLLVLFIGVLIILYLFLGPELFRGGFRRITGTQGWDPIGPMLQSLNAIGDSITAFLRNLFR